MPKYGNKQDKNKKKGGGFLSGIMSMSGAGERRDKKLRDAELKALGIPKDEYYSKTKKMKTGPNQ